MGRLFWKFLLLISLAQLAAVIGLSNVFWMWERSHNEVAPRQTFRARGESAVGAAAAALESSGTEGLKDFLHTYRRPPVFALDAEYRDPFGVRAPDAIIEQLRSITDISPTPNTLRQVTTSEGQVYRLFVPVMRFNGERGPPPGSFPWLLPLPLAPLLATLIGSLICAALLARYLSKPIRNLRTAFASATRGDLETRIAPSMASRNDELANLGRDFDRMTSQIKSLLQNQRQLFHGVSHELRSPLARLQIAVGLARQHADAVPAAMDRIERECRRLDDLVEELLTLSKLETGAMTVSEELVDLGKLVADVVTDAGFENVDRAHSVEFRCDNNAIVLGQPELLHRAIENVVRNAIQHTPPSSNVRVCVETIASSEVSVIVSDTGTGVADNELAAIFTPFFRGGNSERVIGHGLGLAIARQIVEAHRGTIRAANQDRGGLRIEMRFPTNSPGDGV